MASRNKMSIRGVFLLLAWMGIETCSMYVHAGRNVGMKKMKIDGGNDVDEKNNYRCGIQVFLLRRCR